MLKRKDFSQNVQQLFGRGKEYVDYSKFEFKNNEIYELVGLASNSSEEKTEIFDAGNHAMNALVYLKDPNTVIPLISQMERNPDDYGYNEFVLYFLKELDMIAFDNLAEYLINGGVKDSAIYLLEALGDMGKTKNDKNRITDILIIFINLDKSPVLNGFAILSLVKCSKDIHIEFIRDTFKTKKVDFSIMGDLEDIEIDLGLREKRETVFQTNNPQIQEIQELQKKYDLTQSEMLDTLFNNKEKKREVKQKVKIGKNAPCPCGSGKKYKKCCLKIIF